MHQALAVARAFLLSSRLRRRVVGCALAACAIVCVLALIALALASERPVWWRTVRRDDPRTLDLAQRVENGVVNLLYSREQPDQRGEPWRVALSASDANAWLNARMPRWLESEFDTPVDWPEDLHEVQVDFAGGNVSLGIRVASNDQVFWATIDPRLDEQGRLWLPARWVYVGRLPLPARWMIERARDSAPAFIPDDFRALPETDALFRVFAGEIPAFDAPVVRLGDGRRVRLMALDSRADGRLVITCRTERPDGPARASTGDAP